MDVARLRSEAEPGGAPASFRFGRCVYVGDWVAEDPGEAVGSYRDAAERGDVLAPFSLGSCYFNGTGETLAPLEVLLWCHEAVEHGGTDGRNDKKNPFNGAGGGASAIRSPLKSEGAETVSEGPRSDVDPAKASRARSWAEF